MMATESVDQEPEGSGSADKQSQKRSGTSQPAVPPAEPKPDVATSTEGQIRAYQEKNYRLARKQYRVATVTLIVLAVYTCAAAYQARQMWRATNAADSAASTAKDALLKGNRPWLGVDGSATILKPILLDSRGIHADVGFMIKNFGTAPALHVGIDMLVENNSGSTRPDGTVDFSGLERDANASCRMLIPRPKR
jgi:hypothetical protein